MRAREITKSLGGRWFGGFGMALCPAHDDRKPSLKIRDDKTKRDGIDLICFAGCSWQDVKAALQQQGLIEAACHRGPKNATTRSVAKIGQTISPVVAKIGQQVISAEDDLDLAQRLERARQLWQQSIPLPDTLGWKYFTERRGLHIGVLGPLDHALRFHPGKRAVIGLMTDPLTNKPSGVHRTYLRPDATNDLDEHGNKKKHMLGRRGVIRLSRDEDVTTGLGICEGIEDGLAILISGWAPVWAATCAGEIEKFPVLPGIEALTIFADCDVVGTEAARLCAERWRGEQCEVSIEGIFP